MSKSKAKSASKPKSKQSSQKPLDEEALDQVSGGVTVATSLSRSVTTAKKADGEPVVSATTINVLTGANE
jgi:hypothetical protein